MSVALRAHRVLGGGDHALKLAGEVGRLLVKPAQVPFGGCQFGACLGERVGHLDGSAARRLGHAHRLQDQHQCPGGGGERLPERRLLTVFGRPQRPGDVGRLPVHRADEPGALRA